MVLNCDSHQSLSENRGSQSESNEDPIRAYQKREDLSKPYRSLGEELRFSIYYCKADPPLKKKIGGGLYYCRCIVDVTLNRSHNINKYTMFSFKHRQEARPRGTIFEFSVGKPVQASGLGIPNLRAS